MSVKKSLWGLFRGSIAMAILTFLFRKVPFSDVAVAMASAQGSFLVMALLLSFLAHFMAGYRLKFLTDSQGLLLSTYQVVEINFATLFYGLFLPGGNLTGGAIRFYKLSGRERKMPEAFASLVCDRVTATVALCVVGIVFWLVNRPTDSESIAVSMGVVLAGLILPPAVLLHRGVSGRLGKLLAWTKQSDKVEKLVATLERFRHLSLRAWLFILTLSIVSQLVGVVVCYLLALSLGLEFSFATIGWIRSAVVLITLIPISVSGLGLRESAFLVLLSQYGVGAEQALALSLLVFAVTILMMGLLGGLVEGRRFLRQTPPSS